MTRPILVGAVAYDPKVVVILIGINSIDRQTADVAAGVKAVVNFFRTKTPDAKLLLLGIFPKGEKADDPLRARIQAVNQLLIRFADGSRVTYLDVGKRLLTEDGTLTKAIAPDGGHLSSLGYQMWADAILATVTSLLGGYR